MASRESDLQRQHQRTSNPDGDQSGANTMHTYDRERERERDALIAQELAFEEAGEEDVPTVVLFIVAALLLLAFSLYLIVGGGHNHFH